ncbi:hypothetical protein DM01DRAFT_1335269 [Hesseltinella vesiculosa]|uniref:Uncharacterized protein n=1 Tax=Hesseltinella vesiculosa TaxID=101127 RepID=A0A1X2GIZ4_9FUNG|nr:hypothetical protein DM01DRAFT_1335269 [Hesseltinella vesiculosa]
MSYIELGSHVNGLVSNTVFDLLNTNIHIEPFTFRILDIMFGLYINYLYRHSLGPNAAQIGWLQGYLATIVMASGGGCTIALLRGEPLGILKNNEFWIVHSLSYWLMFSNNGAYALMRFLCQLPLVEYAFVMADALGRIMTMVRFGVDGADNALGQGKFFAQWICGVLGGCGGGFWLDSFQLAQPHWSFVTPRCLQQMSPDMKLSALTTTLYMALKYQWLPTDINTDEQAKAWAAIFMTLGLMYNTKLSRNATAAPRPVEEKEKDE